MPSTCFVICPIGEEGSSERSNSDSVLRHIIRPALSAKGYESIVRADGIAEPGIITAQIVQHLLDDDLVVADLTDHNPNVFYELAVRHASDKPVIHLIAKHQKIPFDVAPQRTIEYTLDLDGAELARNKLEEAAAALQARPDTTFNNPLSSAVNIIAVQRTRGHADLSVDEIMLALHEVRADIQGLRRLVSEDTFHATQADYKELVQLGLMLARIEEVSRRPGLVTDDGVKDLITDAEITFRRVMEQLFGRKVLDQRSYLKWHHPNQLAPMAAKLEEMYPIPYPPSVDEVERH